MPHQSFNKRIHPLCPVFGKCGGCLYQNISYTEELEIKQKEVLSLLNQNLPDLKDCLETIISSPQDYHYRHRLDVGLRRRKSGEILVGFMAEGRHEVIEIDSCPIACQTVSDFLPTLRQQAIEKLPPKYRAASLVVKTGADGRVLWGGIGRGSLKRGEEDYLWAEVEGKKIFYSLDTFFQANHFILPLLIQKIKELVSFDSENIFLDLYGGVGLFTILLADLVKHVILVEENPASILLAQHNITFHHLENVEIRSSRVEDDFSNLELPFSPEKIVTMVDPPRNGLAPKACEAIAKTEKFKTLFYLSCSLSSLMRDLDELLKGGWKVTRMVPFDFFPRTKHLETLVLLKK